MRNASSSRYRKISFQSTGCHPLRGRMVNSNEDTFRLQHESKTYLLGRILLTRVKLAISLNILFSATKAVNLRFANGLSPVRQASHKSQGLSRLPSVLHPSIEAFDQENLDGFTAALSSFLVSASRPRAGVRRLRQKGRRAPAAAWPSPLLHFPRRDIG